MGETPVTDLAKLFTLPDGKRRHMGKAFVLVNTALGSEASVKERLKEARGVVAVYQVYGIYDLVVEVEAESDEELKGIVFSVIRSLEQVKSTITLITRL